MSFYNGTLDRKVAINAITETKKEIKYTYGLGFRHPTTYYKPISQTEAIEIINTMSLLDIDEYEDYIHLNAYSSNDMY